MLSGYAVANPTAVDAAQAVRELHHFLYWFYRTYSREPQAANQTFEPRLIPAAVDTAQQSAKQLKAPHEQLEKQDREAAAALAERERQNAALCEELKALQAQVAALKTQHEKQLDSHDTRRRRPANTSSTSCCARRAGTRNATTSPSTK